MGGPPQGARGVPVPPFARPPNRRKKNKPVFQSDRAKGSRAPKGEGPMKIPKLIARTARLPHIAAFAPDKTKSPGTNASILLPNRKRSLPYCARKRSGTLLQPGTPSPGKVRRTVCGSRKQSLRVLAHAWKIGIVPQTMANTFIPDSTLQALHPSAAQLVCFQRRCTVNVGRARSVRLIEEAFGQERPSIGVFGPARRGGRRPWVRAALHGRDAGPSAQGDSVSSGHYSVVLSGYYGACG